MGTWRCELPRAQARWLARGAVTWDGGGTVTLDQAAFDSLRHLGAAGLQDGRIIFQSGVPCIAFDPKTYPVHLVRQGKGAAVSGTEAAWLARLKVTYPGWVVSRGESGFTAVCRATGQQLAAATPGSMDFALFEAEHPPDGRRSNRVHRRRP